MTGFVGAQPLQLEDTVSAAHVGHRLAMGLQCVDALAQRPCETPLVCDLARIGPRVIAQRCEPHTGARQALRHAGRLAKVLARAVETGDPTGFELRVYGQRVARSGGYSVANDPRRFVPRRLRLTPVLDASGVPPAKTDNQRTAWLWPGAAYPLPSGVTALRGRVVRGPTLKAAVPVAWSRVVVTRPAGAPNFAAEKQLGWAHGDDRGEILVILGPGAVPGGAALPATLALRLWVFLPPAAVPFDADDPLASLPLEDGATAVLNDALRGTLPPPGYLQQQARDVAVAPGSVTSISEADLFFT